MNHLSGFRIHWFSCSGDPFETVSVPVWHMCFCLPIRLDSIKLIEIDENLRFAQKRRYQYRQCLIAVASVDQFWIFQCLSRKSRSYQFRAHRTALHRLHSVLRWIPPCIWQQISSDEHGVLPNRFLADILLSLGPDYTGFSLPLLSCLIELCESSECALYIFRACRSELDEWLREACATLWGER
jgi:hypothetical protein